MKPKHILLRSSWQTRNIGDIAHTPGMLALLEKYLPETRVTLWPNELSPEVETLLKTRFPRLEVVRDNAETEIFEECDLALHGSGPGLVGVKTMKEWAKTGKPYGFGGITLSDEELRDHADLLLEARFLLTRDSLSLQAAREVGIHASFFPDATFFLDLKNELAAEAFLTRNGLEDKKFACFIPRLRWTPYWLLKPGTYLPGDIARKEAENEAHAELDHAKMRLAIVDWVRKTGHKALLCPEMTYQVELLRPLLFDPLPDDVKPFVTLRESYWLTDEAASVYSRASAILSFECHSPIIGIVNSTPAIYLRQPTDTRKGQMYRDIGLIDWIFEIDQTTGEQIANRLLGLRNSKSQQSVAETHYLIQKGGQLLVDAIVSI